MEQIGRLQKQWRERARFKGLHARLCLEPDGVVLGAKTLLAKRRSSGGLALDNAPRIATLLAVAYGRPVDGGILGTLRRASKHAEAGNEAMAAMHIALARLADLPDPAAAAERLFIADGLMAEGMAPRDIWSALEFDITAFDALEKFNPDEPRNPKGDGRVSGEWTIGGAAAAIGAAARRSEQVAEQAIREVEQTAERTARGRLRLVENAATDIEGAVEDGSRNVAERLAGEAERAAQAGTEIATRDALSLLGDVAVPAAFLETLVIPTPTGGTHFEGPVPGRPDLRYAWSEDETELHITRATDGRTVLEARLGPDGKFRAGTRVVGRFEDGKLVIDPFTLPSQNTGPDERNEPDLCPNDTPDRPGRGAKGKKDKDYEDFVKRFVNPDNPTPRGYGYGFVNPESGKLVIFDDCQHHTGFMFEAKGTGFAWMIGKNNKKLSDGLAEEFLGQAGRQVKAAGSRQVFWVFAEAATAQFARDLFDEQNDKRIRDIDIMHLEWKEGMK